MIDHPIPDKAIGQPDKTGWNWFDQAEKQVEDSRNQDEIQREDMQRIYADVFGSRKGQAVLKDLMRFVTDVATFDPALGFYNGAAYGFHQEGIRCMVVYQHRMTKAGKEARQTKGA